MERAKIRGLGDAIRSVSTLSGVKYLVNKFIEDCGCDEREIQFNLMFPFIPGSVYVMDEKQLAEWSQIRETIEREGLIPVSLAPRIWMLYTEVFGGTETPPPSCAPCNASKFAKRAKILETSYQMNLKTNQ